MGRIRVLSDNVANKIAAGEVVERPASVVKELLENSLDADATEVRIDAESAGRRLLRIADNGSGMIRDDALLAFERHATSKLSDVKDLLAIETLGFRGEALPSIASVSRLLLETRSNEEQTGTAVEIAGGKLSRCDEIARQAGTTITVRDLFYNVPARKKFLRSDPTELAHIGSLVTHYSLAHPGKRFELYHEGRELLHVTPVDSIQERAFQVFGAGTMDDLVNLGSRKAELRLPPPYVPPHAAHSSMTETEPELSNFCLQGLISGPHVQKLNRNSIFLFVNGRLIRDKLLLHAISAAFHNLIPPACYPFALLFLSCDASEVDVNVHPSKTEVRFRHGSFVHDFVRDTIREILNSRRPASSLPVSATSPLPFASSESQPMHRPFVAQGAAALPFSEFSQMLDSQPVDLPSELNLDALPAGNGPFEKEIPEISLPGVQPVARASHNQTEIEAVASPESVARRVPDTHIALNHLPPEWERVDNLSALSDLHPLGQLHESFIIAAGRDGLWIVDQHVAHERILFEKVLRQRASGRIKLQQLLMPIVLSLTVAQQFEYERVGDELNASGFETETFGQRTIAVKAAPAELNTCAIEQVIFEILETAERELRHASLDDIRRGIAATIACRAAIKVNTKLEPAKIEYLLRALSQCEYPMTCPHGRPIALRYSTRDILRSFHRI